MPVQITIRNVPEEVRDELASKAALEHQSLQGYLHNELVRIASRPTIKGWLHTVRERKWSSGARVSASTILSFRDSDRE